MFSLAVHSYADFIDALEVMCEFEEHNYRMSGGSQEQEFL